jgi:enoyl-CoA hydratase
MGHQSLVDMRKNDGVVTITLNDPHRRNALSWEMVQAITTAVNRCVESRCRALILSNTPPVFSAGGSGDDLLEPKAPLQDMYGAFAAIDAAPFPTIAAIDGAVIGAGLNLAFACDLALCTPDSRFDARFLDVGIHPGGGQLWRLRELIGGQGAAALSLFGEVVSGEEAARLGLVWRCVEPGALLQEAERIAFRAAAHDMELTARVKATLKATAAVVDAGDAVALEWDPQRWSMQRPVFALALEELRSRLGKQ